MADPERPPGVTRRGFLIAGALTGASVARPALLCAKPLDDAAKWYLPPTVHDLFIGGQRTHTLTLRRREDALWLVFDFYNLVRDTDGGGQPILRRLDANRETYVVVRFPPQHVAERALYETDPKFPPDPGDPGGADPLTPPPVGSRLAGESRLAFMVPAAVPSIPYTVEGLLAWTILAQRVVPVALPANARPRLFPMIREPSMTETALEIPWWLILSPHASATWAHRTDPATAPLDYGGRTELWHTRLAAKIGGKAVEGVSSRTVRAVWARDPDWDNPPDEETFPAPGQPFRMSLAAGDRIDLVRSTADFSPGTFTPSAVPVKRLMLSPLGAWVDLRGNWDPPHPSSSLLEWVHRGTMGRDHYVKIVRKGYLLPFGHPAVVIKVSERKFRTVGVRRIAYLFQRKFIVVRKPVKDYGPGAFQMPDLGRGLPFERVEIISTVTPNLDKPLTFVGGIGASLLFVPEVGSKPFRFAVKASDWTGQTAQFTLPMVFVDDTIARNATNMTDAGSAYETDVALSQTGFDGQSVAVAEPASAGDTSVEVVTMHFGTKTLSAGGDASYVTNDQARFHPRMVKAGVRLSVAEQASGASLSNPSVEFDPTFLSVGFGGANKGEVFLKVIGAGADLAFGSNGKGERGGGMVTPNLSIGGLSRVLGPVAGDLSMVKAGKFDPEQYFKDLSAKFLGGIDLWDVVSVVADFTASADALDKALTMTARLIPDTGTPQQSEVTIRWKPELQEFPSGLGSADGLFVPGPDASFLLEVVILTDLANPSDSTSTITADLRDATVNLFSKSSPLRMIVVPIRRLTFVSVDGSKPDVTPDIGTVTFDGPLKFIQELSEFLESTGVGPSIEVSGSGISAGITIAIPSITVGVFSMQNLSLGVSIMIPFTGDPLRLRACFCSREDPFLLTVYGIGGGGFVCVALGTDGFEMMEAALEVGASISLDVGIASGSVYMLAGFYFKLENTGAGQSIYLEGYFRAGGELDVLGIVSISIELYIGLAYIDDPSQGIENKVIGRASLTIEVEVLFFSISASVEVERRFGGSGDPPFVDRFVAQPVWDTYADAFAAGLP